MAEFPEEMADAAALLGTVFYQDPVSEKGRAALDWFVSEEVRDTWVFGGAEALQAIQLIREACSPENEIANHEEYNRLFIGPYSLPAPPWASVYTDPEGVIFGNATLGVRQWLRDNQVKISLPMNEPEDQFGLMLMTLSWSLRNGVDDAAVRDFLSNHLMTWAPYFLEVFLRGTDNPLYQGTGRLAAATLADWNDRFQLEVPKINLHRRD